MVEQYGMAQAQIIHRPLRWWDMVTPSEQEMNEFLRAYVGADHWRVPSRRWQDLFMLNFGRLTESGRLKKYQRGMVQLVGKSVQTAVYAGGVIPILTDITNATSSVAPTASRQQYAFDSDGGIEGDTDATTEATIVYVAITTQTDDANDHTNEWWPDQPDVNEGLNWDIRYLNESTPLNSGVYHLLADNTGTNRATNTWFLLDTVSNDHVDASHDGGIGCNRPNGTAKTPNVGLDTLTVDIDIRATGSGGPVASMSFDLDVEGT